MHAGERPKETAEVVALQNYLNECRDEKIYKLKDDIKVAAKRVLFLLHHATLDGKRKQKFISIFLKFFINLYKNQIFEDAKKKCF